MSPLPSSPQGDYVQSAKNTQGFIPCIFYLHKCGEHWKMEQEKNIKCSRKKKKTHPTVLQNQPQEDGAEKINQDVKLLNVKIQGWRTVQKRQHPEINRLIKYISC